MRRVQECILDVCMPIAMGALIGIGVMFVIVAAAAVESQSTIYRSDAGHRVPAYAVVYSTLEPSSIVITAVPSSQEMIRSIRTRSFDDLDEALDWVNGSISPNQADDESPFSAGLILGSTETLDHPELVGIFELRPLAVRKMKRGTRTAVVKQTLTKTVDNYEWEAQ